MTSSALPSPTLLGLVTQWSVQPVALTVAVLTIGWYLRGVRRTPVWPARRLVGFFSGSVIFVWATNGFPQVYSHSLFWVWTTQVLLLLLIVPTLIMSGQPVALARTVHGPDASLARVTRSAIGRLFANPLVGPALIPLLSGVLFFGPLPRWAIQYPSFGWTLPILVVAAGALIVLPLVTSDDVSSSMAVGLALAIGMVELVLDAVPGIILRLSTHLTTSYFDARVYQSWAPTPLHDQQIAGAIVWTVAELIDLPFLVLVYLRWLRADEREAARIDTVLDAERIARGGDDAAPTDAPWWLSDPTMRDRLR